MWRQGREFSTTKLHCRPGVFWSHWRPHALKVTKDSHIQFRCAEQIWWLTALLHRIYTSFVHEAARIVESFIWVLSYSVIMASGALPWWHHCALEREGDCVWKSNRWKRRKERGEGRDMCSWAVVLVCVVDVGFGRHGRSSRGICQFSYECE